MSISEVAIWATYRLILPEKKLEKRGGSGGWSDDLHITSQIQNQIPLSIPVIWVTKLRVQTETITSADWSTTSPVSRAFKYKICR